MTREQLEAYTEAHRANKERYYANGIDYTFVPLLDGWTAIFEYNRGQYIPLIQASDRNHAISYCQLREPLPVPVQELIPR